MKKSSVLNNFKRSTLSGLVSITICEVIQIIPDQSIRIKTNRIDLVPCCPGISDTVNMDLGKVTTGWIFIDKTRFIFVELKF